MKMLEQRRICTQKALKKRKKAKTRDLADKYLNVSLSIQFVSAFSGIYSSHLPTRVIVNFTKKSLDAKVIHKLATIYGKA